MVFRFLTAAYAVCLLSSPSMAGLQSAMEALLQGERVAGVLGAWLNESPDGALFVNPLKSTRAEVIYRVGPEFNYDSTTGDVEIIAPPMLGPADEFGQRLSLAPTKATFYFGGEIGAHRGDVPGEVGITSHLRMSYLPQGGTPLSLLPSFWSFSAIYEINRFGGPQQLRIDRPTSFFSGFEFSIPGLLKSELSSEIFATPPIIQVPAIELHTLRVPLGVGGGYYQPLPEISVVIDYVATSADSALGASSPHSYRLLAQVNIIPEPTSAVLLAAGILTLPRRRSRPS
jgi:hypothetical protein